MRFQDKSAAFAFLEVAGVAVDFENHVAGIWHEVLRTVWDKLGRCCVPVWKLGR